MEEVFEFLKNAGTWYLATVDDEGNPQVRPFGAQNIFEGKLYIQTGLKKMRRVPAAWLNPRTRTANRRLKILDLKLHQSQVYRNSRSMFSLLPRTMV